MTDKINDINQKFKGKKLLAFDETTGQFAMVSPHILTSTVYTEEGVPLDDYLVVSPKQVLDKLDEILKGAPKDYDTFLEVAKALNTNQDSIVEILREISKRVKKPENGTTGQVLKLDENGEIVFADDNDTVYTPPETIDASKIVNDSDRRFVTDREKDTWNNKLDSNSDISNNKVVSIKNPSGYENLKDLFKDNDRDIKTLLDFITTKGKNNGFAELDSMGKVPKAQIPSEAFVDTKYNLQPYALKTDIAKDYATKTDLENAKSGVNNIFTNYLETVTFEDFKTANNTALDKKENIVNRGAVNGYASLDAKGKVPKEQLPQEALQDTTYDLSPYAKTKDIKSTYATKQEVQAGKLDYVAENANNKGKANGYASLDDTGKVPAGQLPSYVDDVLEFSSKSNFPSAGEKGKIYVDLATENIYRWSGTTYVEISPSLITQADINKLNGIEAEAQKNNVTQEMINRWNNKWDSASGKDISRGKTDGYGSANAWTSVSTTRDLEDWIGDFDKRTRENKENIEKKANIVSMSLADYNNLTTKDPNTLYLTY